MRARFINEASLESLDLKDVVNKNSIGRWIEDNYVSELFVYSYAQEHGEDVEELLDNDFIDSKEFEKWFEYEMESRYFETLNKFNYGIIDGSSIPIWRSIKVKPDWVNHLEKFGGRLGIYWSWDKDAAEPHWGYGGEGQENDVVIESEVNINHINWIETVQANMHPSYEEEKEINLFKNTPLRIKKLEENGKEIDISNIKNKIFKA